MIFKLSAVIAFLAGVATASPLTVSVEQRNNNCKKSSEITYLGDSGAILSGGTKFGDLVFVSGQVPTLNGTIVEGGIQAETALVLEKIGAILEEAGTDWSRVLKTTVLLQDIEEFDAMNEVYSTVLPAGAKPARAAYQVGNLPVDGIRVEIEAIAAMP